MTQTILFKRALLLIMLLITSCLILYVNFVRERITSPFAHMICCQATWTLKLIGVDVYGKETTIAGSGFSVNIKNGCNAVYEIILFIVSVVVYPSSLKYKFFGITLGAIAIYIVNLLRVVILFLTGICCRNLFNMVHDHVSQCFIVFFMVVLWLLWASQTKRKKYCK